jgi:hypothetical protein
MPSASLDVPKREVERAERVGLLASRWIEPSLIHVVPNPFDEKRIFADQTSSALLE